MIIFAWFNTWLWVWHQCCPARDGFAHLYSCALTMMWKCRHHLQLMEPRPPLCRLCSAALWRHGSPLSDLKATRNALSFTKLCLCQSRLFKNRLAVPELRGEEKFSVHLLTAQQGPNSVETGGTTFLNPVLSETAYHPLSCSQSARTPEKRASVV